MQQRVLRQFRDIAQRRIGRVALHLARQSVLAGRLLTSTWVVWQMSMEIRDGTLSSRLLRPIHPLYAYAAQQSRQAANTVYEECGGSGLAESSDLQRIWRDANAAAAHHGLTWDWQADQWTRASFGLPAPGVNA